MLGLVSIFVSSLFILEFHLINHKWLFSNSHTNTQDHLSICLVLSCVYSRFHKVLLAFHACCNWFPYVILTLWEPISSPIMNDTFGGPALIFLRTLNIILILWTLGHCNVDIFGEFDFINDSVSLCYICLFYILCFLLLALKDSTIT